MEVTFFSFFKSKTVLIDLRLFICCRQALEKKRNAAAVVIQSRWRRVSSLFHSVQMIREKLNSQLSTISKIRSMMAFNVPLDTLLTLVRYIIFVSSSSLRNSSGIVVQQEDEQAYRDVLELVVVSCAHCDAKFCLFELVNVSNQLQQWQVLVASFLTIVVRDLQHRLSGRNSVKKSDQNTLNTADSVVMNEITLIHAFAVNVKDIHGQHSDLRMGMARIVSMSLCSLLLNVCNEKYIEFRGLANDITDVLRIALKIESGEREKSAGVLGISVISYQVNSIFIILV